MRTPSALPPSAAVDTVASADASCVVTTTIAGPSSSEAPKLTLLRSLPLSIAPSRLLASATISGTSWPANSVPPNVTS